LFYGYPGELVARVCRVSLQSAYHYKSGIRKPSPQVQRLWELYVAGRIVPESWQGFRFGEDDVLYDLEDKPLTVRALSTYSIVWQLLHELTKDDPEAQSFLVSLSDVHEILRKKRARKRSARDLERDRRWNEASDFVRKTYRRGLPDDEPADLEAAHGRRKVGATSA
jgi:hypothetical protein